MATSRKHHQVVPAASFTDLIAKHEANPTNRLVAAAKKYAEACDDVMYAEAARAETEVDLENAVMVVAASVKP